MTTNLTRRLLVSAACIAALAVAAPALAQEPAQTAPAAGTTAIKSVILADVNVTNATSTKSGDTLTGSFMLQGKQGMQNDVIYGVVLLSDKGKLLGAERLGSVEALRQGENKNISFTYRVPSYLQGKVTAYVMAETAGGVQLGVQPLLTWQNTGSGPALSCALTAATTIGCTFLSAVADTVTVTARPTLLSDVKTPVQTISGGKKGDKVSVNLAAKEVLVPGRYVVSVASANEDHLFQVRIPGEFASLRNVLVSQRENGSIVLTAAFIASPYLGTSIQYVAKDTSGTVCDEGSRANDLPGVVEIELKQTCTSGNVEVKFIGASGTVLSSTNTPFDVIPVRTAGGAAPLLTTGVLLLVVVVAMLITVLLFAYMKKRRAVQQVTMMGVFALIAVCSFGQRAEAISGQIYSIELGVPEVAHMCDYTVSTDKDTYAPGENMIVSGSIAIFNDIGDGSGVEASCSIGYASTEFDPAPIFDVSTFGNSFVVVGSGKITPPYWGNSSRSFAVPSAQGSHYLAVRPLLQSWRPSGASYANAYTYESLPFTVASTPTVQVWFGP